MTDRKVTISVQKNGNKNKIVTREAELGQLGEVEHRVRWARFGQARVFDATIRVTSPVAADLMGGVAEIESE